MSLHYRATDRKSHSHTLGFRGEEALKNAIHHRCVQPNPGILNRNHGITIRVALSSYVQNPRPIRDATHRLHAVHNQIQDNLLQLHTVAGDRLEVGAELSLERDTLSA